MIRFSANLSMLFNEVDFISRFKRASKAGFRGVEYLFPYEWEKDRLSEALDKYHLTQVLHNLPAGNWQTGERGIACLPGRESEFQDGVGLAIEYAKALQCGQLNCLAGIPTKESSIETVHKTLVENLRFAAHELEKEGIKLLIEALNNHDVPGFYLVHTQDVVNLLKEVNHPNIWIQYDVYHMQIMEGNLTKTIRDNLSHIAHIQVADTPGRHEPGTGEINYFNLFHFIDETGYDGWIGCEYNPTETTEASLEWVKPYLKKGGK